MVEKKDFKLQKDEMGYIPSNDIRKEFINDIEYIKKEGNLDNIEKRNRLLNIMLNNNIQEELYNIYSKLIFN